MDQQDLEAQILGNMLVAPSAAVAAVGVIEAGDFTIRANATLFAQIERMVRSGAQVDLITVTEALKRDGKELEVGGFTYIAGLGNDAFGAISTDAHCELLKDYSNRRKLRALAAEVMNDHLASAMDLHSRLSSALGRMDLNAKNVFTFSEAIDQAMAQMERASLARKAGKAVGVPYGLPALDQRTGGAMPGELVGIAARTSIGKTGMLNQIGTYAGLRGDPGLLITLEEEPAAVAMRSIANLGSINISKMRQGYESEMEKAATAVGEHNLHSLPLYVAPRDERLPTILSRISEYHAKHGIKYAILDHIGLVKVDGFKDQRQLAVGEVTRSLKMLAGRLGIPIFVAVQLNREADKDKPTLITLAESGKIEQDLNVAIFLYAPKIPQQGPIPCEIGILKNRYGRRGWLAQRFEFNGKYQQFRELADDEPQYEDTPAPKRGGKKKDATETTPSAYASKGGEA